MPRGTHHRLTGRLMETQRGLVLEMDDGGSFELDTNRSARKLLGMRVTLEGTRSGFNLIDVERIEPAQPR